MADPATGELLGRPVTIVTDNGGPFRSARFARFIDRPDLHHVRTRVRSPGQNGSRERGFGTLKYEKLFLDEIVDGIELQALAEAYRIEYSPEATITPTCDVTATPGLKADSTGRRNTLIVEVFSGGDEVLVCEDE